MGILEIKDQNNRDLEQKNIFRTTTNLDTHFRVGSDLAASFFFLSSTLEELSGIERKIS